MKKFSLQTLEVLGLFLFLSACGKGGSNSAATALSGDSGGASSLVEVDANREMVNKVQVKTPQETSPVSLEVFSESRDPNVVGVHYSSSNDAGRGLLERASKLLMEGSQLSEVSESVKQFINYVAKMELESSLVELEKEYDVKDEVTGSYSLEELRNKESEYRAALKLFENRKFHSSEIIREQQALIKSLQEAIRSRPDELKALDKEIEDINAIYNPQIQRLKTEISNLSFGIYGISDLKINTEVNKRYEDKVWGIAKISRRVGDWFAFWDADAYPFTNSKKAQMKEQLINEIKEGDFVPPGVPTDAGINSKIATLKSQRDRLAKEQAAKIKDVNERITLYSYAVREPDIEDSPSEYVKFNGKYIPLLAAQQSISAAETLIASEAPFANSEISAKNPEVAKVLEAYKEPLDELRKHNLSEQVVQAKLRLKSLAIGTDTLRALDCVEEIRRKGLPLASKDLGIFNLSTDKRTRIDLVLQQDILKDSGDVAYFTLLAVNKEGFLVSLSSSKALAPKKEIYDLKEYMRYSNPAWLDLRGLKNEGYTLVACSHSQKGHLTSHSKQITLQAR